MPSGELVVERYESAERFLAEVGPWLAADEPASNLILALAHSLVGDDHPFHEPIFLAAVRDRGTLVGCAVRPPPDHIDLSPMPAGAATLMAASAADHCPGLDAIGGEAAVAGEFAAEWARRRGGAWQITHRWSWLVLREVRPPPPVPGVLRVARADDWPLVRSWAPLYMRDTNATGNVLHFLERRLHTHSLFVWEHDGPKCMASVSGHTPNGLRVSAVFTPEEHRRRGYASNTVATISQRALASGLEYCVLFAESHHAATLRVYEAIGYRNSHTTVLLEPSAA
jgi:GNAT superfamily N-acetyltransferase